MTAIIADQALLGQDRTELVLRKIKALKLMLQVFLNTPTILIVVEEILQ
jgi:hypothetical protein